MTAQFAAPEDFAYDRVRRHFQEGEALQFDPRYRYAQLPLIAPGHPAALQQSPDGVYRNGSYADARISVVARVPPDFGGLASAAMTTSFGHKIDHALTDRRKDLLHVTLAGGLESRPREDLTRALQGAPAFSMRLYGPLIGQFNAGRMYLPAVPTRTAFHDLQRRLGVPLSDFFACGLLHFRAELSPAQTADLHRFLQLWESKVVLEVSVDALWVMSTHDDLALDSSFEAQIGLTP